MLWADLAPLLKSTITSLALDTTDPLWQGAEWRTQQHAFVSPSTQVQIDMKITVSADITSKVERFAFDPAANGGAGDLSSSMHGMRNFTLNVQIKSYDATYAMWANEYAERIRTRIWRSGVTDVLIARNLTPVSMGAITDVPGKEDGQALSVVNFDMFFRAGFTDAPVTGVGWIDSILLTSHVSNPGGVEYPAPPNFVNAPLPPPAP